MSHKDQRPLPVTYCMKCGKAGHNIAASKIPCGQTITRKRCRGAVRRATGVNDWRECPTCFATGWDGDKFCTQCNGDGWLFAR